MIGAWLARLVTTDQGSDSSPWKALLGAGVKAGAGQSDLSAIARICYPDHTIGSVAHRTARIGVGIVPKEGDRFMARRLFSLFLVGIALAVGYGGWSLIARQQREIPTLTLWTPPDRLGATSDVAKPRGPLEKSPPVSAAAAVATAETAATPSREHADEPPASSGESNESPKPKATLIDPGTDHLVALGEKPAPSADPDIRRASSDSASSGSDLAPTSLAEKPTELEQSPVEPTVKAVDPAPPAVAETAPSPGAQPSKTTPEGAPESPPIDSVAKSPAPEPPAIIPIVTAPATELPAATSGAADPTASPPVSHDTKTEVLPAESTPPALTPGASNKPLSNPIEPQDPPLPLDEQPSALREPDSSIPMAVVGDTAPTSGSVPSASPTVPDSSSPASEPVGTPAAASTSTLQAPPMQPPSLPAEQVSAPSLNQQPDSTAVTASSDPVPNEGTVQPQQAPTAPAVSQAETIKKPPIAEDSAGINPNATSGSAVTPTEDERSQEESSSSIVLDPPPLPIDAVKAIKQKLEPIAPIDSAPKAPLPPTSGSPADSAAIETPVILPPASASKPDMEPSTVAATASESETVSDPKAVPEALGTPGSKDLTTPAEKLEVSKSKPGASVEEAPKSDSIPVAPAVNEVPTTEREPSGTPTLVTTPAPVASPSPVTTPSPALAPAPAPAVTSPTSDIDAPSPRVVKEAEAPSVATEQPRKSEPSDAAILQMFERKPEAPPRAESSDSAIMAKLNAPPIDIPGGSPIADSRSSHKATPTQTEANPDDVSPFEENAPRPASLIQKNEPASGSGLARLPVPTPPTEPQPLSKPAPENAESAAAPQPTPPAKLDHTVAPDPPKGPENKPAAARAVPDSKASTEPKEIPQARPSEPEGTKAPNTPKPNLAPVLVEEAETQGDPLPIPQTDSLAEPPPIPRLGETASPPDGSWKSSTPRVPQRVDGPPPARNGPPAANTEPVDQPQSIELPGAVLPSVQPLPPPGAKSDSDLRKTQEPAGQTGTKASSTPGASPEEVNPLPPARETKPVPAATTSAGTTTAPKVEPQPFTEGEELPAEKLNPGRQDVALTVDVVASQVVNLYQTASIKVVVRNAGRSDAQNVMVRQTLPSGFEYVESQPEAAREGSRLAWRIGVLPAGGEKILTLRARPTTIGSFDHTATVSLATGGKARTMVQQPKLKVDVVATPTRALKGEPVQFAIEVSNPGTGTARDVVVQAKLSRGLRHELGELVEKPLAEPIPPGKTVRIGTLSVDTIAGGPQVCEIVALSPDVVKSSNSPGTPEQDEARQVLNLTVVEPQLTLKVEGPIKRFTDTIANYQAKIDNPGTATANNVRVVVSLPTGGTLVQVPDRAQYDRYNRRILWTIPQLEAGKPISLPFSVRLGGIQLYQVAAEARGDGGLFAKNTFSTDVSGMAFVDVVVTERYRVLDVGDSTVCDIRIKNTGSKEATGMKLRAKLSDNLDVVETTGTEADAKFLTTTREIEFPELPRLAPGASTLLTVKLSATKPGPAVCRVTLTHDDLGNVPIDQSAVLTVTANTRGDGGTTK